MDMVNLNVLYIYFISFLFYLTGKFLNIIINFRILVSPVFFNYYLFFDELGGQY